MRTIILFVLLTYICVEGKSQTVGLSLENSIKPTPQYFPFKKQKLHVYNSVDIANQQVVKNMPHQIPSIFSVETLPFFCKIEYKMGLNKKLPLKFRLGDVQYVDEMEGKHRSN